MTITIGVIGQGEIGPDDAGQISNIAEAVGAAVARRGAVLVTGGRQGVMEAASRGAKGANGVTIGFLPTMDRADANPYVDIIFPTGLGRARNLIIARGCDALIMVGGGAGTLNELTIAYAEGRPVVVVRGSGGWADRIASVLYDGKYLDERKIVEISISDGAEEAVAIAIVRGASNDEWKSPFPSADCVAPRRV
jgi:uncharacterized protein (TIGR00725 family)